MFTLLWDYQIFLRWHILPYSFHPLKWEELWFEYLPVFKMFCDVHKDLIKPFLNIQNLKNALPRGKDSGCVHCRHGLRRNSNRLIKFTNAVLFKWSRRVIFLFSFSNCHRWIYCPNEPVSSVAQAICNLPCEFNHIQNELNPLQLNSFIISQHC